MDPTPIVAIAGQTATGKSAVAVEMAERFGGEIICADSRTIYRYMDISTAKPSAEDRARVPHHGLDLIDPNQTFSAYDFQQYAKSKIAEIHARGNVPFVVGGTGLYIDGLLYDYSFGPKADMEKRTDLSDNSLKELQQLAEKIGLSESDVSFKNRRHLTRAIERGKITLQKKQLPGNVFLWAIRTDSDALRMRIAERTRRMVKDGLIDEVQSLVGKYGRDAPGLQAPMYKAFSEYILGERTIDDAVELATRYDYQLAKRQLTWFKRNPDIAWVQSVDQLKKEITLQLTKI